MWEARGRYHWFDIARKPVQHQPMGTMIYYAIGDVHGEAGLLADLHARIFNDARGKPAHIIHLGDLIDRGPDSRKVIDLVMALQADPPPQVHVTTLLGNHEAMMLDALNGPDPGKLRLWRRNGGDETLQSYGLDPNALGTDWANAIPSTHMAWLRRLPTEHYDPDRRLVFVHAGIDPATFPACGAERRLWTRSPGFFDTLTWPDRPELEGLLVVHGHTPVRVPVPEIGLRRINLDTGACFGGPLSAIALRMGREPQILQAYRPRRVSSA